MNKSAEMIDFLKALAHVDRLHIIGILTDGPASRDRIVHALSLPARRVYNHLEFLKYVRIIHETEGLYYLDETTTNKLSRSFINKPVDSSPAIFHPDRDCQKILASCLHPDGSIRRIPNSRTNAHALRLLLEYLITAFEPQIEYSEKEVNSILSSFHSDTAGLRRDLIDIGLLNRERDGSRYWREVVS